MGISKLRVIQRFLYWLGYAFLIVGAVVVVVGSLLF
jgi:hypothetical protein